MNYIEAYSTHLRIVNNALILLSLLTLHRYHHEVWILTDRTYSLSLIALYKACSALVDFLIHLANFFSLITYNTTSY
jgi:hypothetical protein